MIMIADFRNQFSVLYKIYLIVKMTYLIFTEFNY